MATERVHLRCPFCGSLRRFDYGDPTDEILKPGPLELMTQIIASSGRGRIKNTWIPCEIHKGLEAADLRDLLSSLIENAEQVLNNLKEEWEQCTRKEWEEEDEEYEE